MARATLRTGVAACVLATAFGGWLVLGGLGAAGASGPSNGVGIYPSSVSFNSALRGGEYVQNIGIVNGSSEYRVFRFSTSGSMARWLSVVASDNSLEHLTRLNAPPGTTTVQLRLVVPPRAGDGSYSGSLDIVARPLKGPHPKGSIPVSVAARVDVSAQVTGTQVIAGTLIKVSSYPAIEVGDPLWIFSTIKNASNVIVQPEFQLKITRGASVVYDHTSLGDGLIPGANGKSEVVWPATATGSQLLGTYEVHLRVSFPGLLLGTRELKVRLAPYGSLHRSGRLLGLKLLTQPKVGDPVEVGASLVNTGAVQANSSFQGTLYFDGALVRAVRSFRLLLLPRQPGVATVIVPVSKDGTYRLVGVGSFAGAQSNSMSLTFQVGDPSFPILYPIIGGVAVLLLALVLLGRRSKRSRPSVAFSQGGHVQGQRRGRARQPARQPTRRHVRRRPQRKWMRVIPDPLRAWAR